jgi:hypothetical protein
MNKLKNIGVLSVILGLLIIVTPIVLPVCHGLLELASGKQVPMRCFWTARAEMVFGALLVAAGLTQMFSRTVEARRRVSHQIALLGIVTFLTPLFIIPTCANPEMSCNVATKPALLILGGLTLLVGLYGSRNIGPTLETNPTG